MDRSRYPQTPGRPQHRENGKLIVTDSFRFGSVVADFRARPMASGTSIFESLTSERVWALLGQSHSRNGETSKAEKGSIFMESPVLIKLRTAIRAAPFKDNPANRIVR